MDILKKLRAVLNKKQKRQVALLVFMIVLGALLETASVSMILPVVQVVVDPGIFQENKYMLMVRELFGINTPEQFLIVMIVVLIGIFIIKNLYLLFMYYVQHSFVTGSQYRTSGIFLHYYLHKPYEFFLNAETSDLLRTIYSDTGSVFTLVLECIQFLTEAIVGLFLTVALLAIDFKMTVIVAGLLFAVSAVAALIIKPFLRRTGEESRKRQSRMYKAILESVTAIKDVKVFGKEDSFLGIYREQGRRYYNLVRNYNVVSNIPKLLVETVCICAILAYLAIMVMTGHSVTAMLPQLSAFALAAARLMPCASRMNTYLANISYYQPALDYVYENVKMPGEAEDLPKAGFSVKGDSSAPADGDRPQGDRPTQGDRPQGDRPLSTLPSKAITSPIVMEDISYRYPNTEAYIFKNASLTILPGKSVGIVGASGAGKSTIVDILLGLLKPENGSITLDGANVFDDYTCWLSRIGYIPQTIHLTDDTIRANIAFGLPENEISDERVREVVEEAQLTEFVKQLPQGLETIVGEQGVRLSGGQRQRIGIARALYHDPGLLVLDEATSALDNDTESAIMEAITRFKGKKTMLIIAHRLGTIADCDMVYRVNDGKLKKER